MQLNRLGMESKYRTFYRPLGLETTYGQDFSEKVEEISVSYQTLNRYTVISKDDSSAGIIKGSMTLIGESSTR
ncbi:hypothetical protein [Domibacillus antri]|uniref:hypothetical protein n=1 Tax=Domibacillus antri TaxID=1714264 RepID=UPI0011785EF7|nr:hypothetical protein [Domibacillus antri]